MKLIKWLLGGAGAALLGVVSTQVQAQLAPGLTPGNASLNDAPPISAPNWGGAHWHGDVGLAEYAMPNWVSASNSAKKSTVLPYLFGQTEVFFARVDTFGIKTLPIGWGHLELAGRLSFEGETVPGLAPRRNPLPLGLGTFQETPVGGFFLHAFHDSVSGGQLWDFNYAAEFDWHGLGFYPQLGAQWRSARYVNHLVGVSASEALHGPWRAYSAGASTTPVLALAVQMPFSVPLSALGWGPITSSSSPSFSPSSWSLLMEWRRKWADAAMGHSPLVPRRVLDDGMLSVVYSFE